MIHILGRDRSQSSPNFNIREARDLDLELAIKVKLVQHLQLIALYFPSKFRSNRRQNVWTALLGIVGEMA